MPTDIKLKNSVTATNAPTSLQQGEVAINITDKKVWVGNAATTPVLLLGSGADGTFTNLTVSGVASFADGTVSLPSITNIGDTNTGIYFPAADTIAFTEGGAESMRIDASGNVGIGVTAPAVRLDLLASGSGDIVKFGVSASSRIINFYRDSANFAVTDASGIAGNGMYGITTTNNLAFLTNSGERMRITSTGNVGIGTSSPQARLQVNSGGIASYWDSGSSNGSQLYLGSSGFDNASYWNSAPGIGAIFNSDAGVAGNLGVYVYSGTANSRAEVMRFLMNGNVGIGTAGPATKLEVSDGAVTAGAGGFVLYGRNSSSFPSSGGGYFCLATNNVSATSGGMSVLTNNAGTLTERMRIDSSGNLFLGKTARDFSTTGINLQANGGDCHWTASDNLLVAFNRLSTDGTLVEFAQASAVEGSISVSGSTVSYNGGHLSRWSQWQNQTGKPEVYRGSVLESTNDMCQWNQENEQATKTIVSTTAKSKAVAGVFDMYDLDDENNPHDFYVAQSGDFVIRIAQGVVVENGDLLESAGDGTARPQTDDICRSSTVAKVTSNYVSTTYADGSYCVPCILMIG